VAAGQIVISNSRSSFLKSATVDPLMVEDAAMRNPHRAGLLFDGSSASVIAKPLMKFLNFLGAMVGR